MSSVAVKALIPHQAVLQMPKSTSQHIIRRRQLEMLSLENTEFSYNGNDSIKFNISSSTEVMDGMSNYIKMSYYNTTTEAVADQHQCFCLGGVHSLFRELELRTQNGTLIQRYRRYNRWYATISSATHSPEHVELVEAAAGDSMDCKQAMPMFQGNLNTFTYTAVSAIAFVDATNTLTLTGGNAVNEVEVGDIIQIGVAAASWYAEVASITNKNTIILVDFAAANNRNLPAADLTANTILYIGLMKASDRNSYLPQRAAIPQTAISSATKVSIQWKPAVSFLQQKTWIPLAFIKQGLQLELRLDRPEHVLNKGLRTTDQDGTSMSYTITDPRYVAMLYTLDESIMGEYLKQFNSQGLHMSILGYEHDRRTFDNTATSLNANFHIGVRSARHVFGIVQSSRLSEAVGRAAQGNDSIDLFIDGGITSYQFQSGSEEFPMREVLCDNFSTEALQQLMLSTNQHGGTLWNVRFSPKEWRRENTVYSATTDTADDVKEVSGISTKFIFSTRLDRNDDNFTGLDLSLNPLDLRATATATDANLGDRIVNVFVAHDILVSISSDGLVVRK